jgi:protein PhnA
LTDDTREWAMGGVKATAPSGPRTLDSNGAELSEGDSVTLIKDLDVKGTSFVAKRGTLVSRIRLTDNPEHVEGKVNGITIVLKTVFLKKA